LAERNLHIFSVKQERGLRLSGLSPNDWSGRDPDLEKNTSI
jgi:hypothetical protein